MRSFKVPFGTDPVKQAVSRVILFNSEGGLYDTPDEGFSAIAGVENKEAAAHTVPAGKEEDEQREQRKLSQEEGAMVRSVPAGAPKSGVPEVAHVSAGASKSGVPETAQRVVRSTCRKEGEIQRLAVKPVLGSDEETDGGMPKLSAPKIERQGNVRAVESNRAVETDAQQNCGTILSEKVCAILGATVGAPRTLRQADSKAVESSQTNRAEVQQNCGAISGDEVCTILVVPKI